MRILVVDDEESVVDFLEKSLRKDKHVVDIARNGIEAKEKIIDNSYDTILLDVVMPIQSGVDVCKELRSGGVQTPIVMLTSSGSEAARIEGLNAGADDYVTKPFSYGELAARIRAITRRPRQLQPDTLTVGELTLDPDKKIISMSGQPINFRPKEYALLEYLMRHAGKVIPKDELLKNVWRISANNASNRLEVCMYHIRRKINNKDTLLKTIRGYGYIIEA